jgi:glycine/D-amino acid oxidase-like deaminating enzyme
VPVVICGAGVIGASIAYFLARRGIRPVVVERTGVACAASGKSGGFLAFDWCDRTPLEFLARRSFVLHATLPEELKAGWGFRRLTTYAGVRGSGRRARAGSGPQWLSEKVVLTDRLGSPDTTAQVHPGEFTAAMMRAAEARGAELRIGAVTRIVSQGNHVEGVEVDGDFLAADAVVFAMGPWSILASQWLSIADGAATTVDLSAFDPGRLGRAPRLTLAT